MNIESLKKGFNKGFQQLRRKDEKEVKECIMKALSINNDVSWAWYLHGRREPKLSQGVAIEQIFKSYGITEIWGE